jgi:hypothetical protein
VGIVGGYLLLIVGLSLDEWIGKKIGGRKRMSRQSLLEMFGGTELDMLYDDAHSFLGLMGNQQDNIDAYRPPSAAPQQKYDLI